MKRWKNLGLLVFFLVFLIVATILTRNISVEPELTEAEEKSVELAIDSSALTSLSWNYDGEEIALRKDTNGWVYADDAKFPLNTVKADSLASALASVKAEKVIESPDELSQYGLDAPVCSITANTGNDITLMVGSQTSMDGYRYLSNGDGNVYLVSSDLLTNFSCGLYDLVLKETIPSMKNLLSMSVSSEVQDYEIDHIEASGIAYTDEYEWFLKGKDGWLTLDNSLASGFANKIRNLNWQTCVDYHADESDLSSYGLASPSAVVEMRYLQSSEIETNLTTDDGEPIYETVKEEKTFTLELGSYTDSSCYARIAGSPMIYCVDASVLDDLLYMDYEDLRPDDIIVLDLTELLGVDISLDGLSYLFEKISTAETVDEETSVETVWLLSDREADIESVLRKLMNLTATGFADNEQPKRTAEISFVFERKNTLHPVTELVIYPYDSTYSLVTLNGESTVFISRYDADAIKAELEEMVAANDSTSEEGSSVSGNESVSG